MTHLLLILLSASIILTGNWALTKATRGIASGRWSQRRGLHLLALATPVVGLLIGLTGVNDLVAQTCSMGIQMGNLLADATLGVATLSALGAMALGVVRLVLTVRLLARDAVAAPPDLQAMADRLADAAGRARVRLSLCAADYPLAVTWGIQRPRALLSTWMIRELDFDELETVLAHELSHAARHDFMVNWLATVLRDAFFYLPTSRAAYREFKRDNELACDDQAAGATGQPLALASALAKVWYHFASGSAPLLGQSLVAPSRCCPIEDRIERLSAVIRHDPLPADARTTHNLGMVVLTTLLVLVASNIAIQFVPMACSASPLVCGVLR